MSAAQVKLFILDVDGVMTDGGIILDSEGRELKRFNVYDGTGVKYLQRAGLQVALISGRHSESTLFEPASWGSKSSTRARPTSSRCCKKSSAGLAFATKRSPTWRTI